jgi:sarcosine oxidase subunit beta
VSRKTIVCRCEDVTLDELLAGIARGYSTIEELKRFTGLGTGPCQGKECQSQVAHLLERAGAAPTTIAPFTARPPFAPTPLRLLAGVPAAHGDDQGEPT